MNSHDDTNDRNSDPAELFTKTEAAAFLTIKNRTLDDWRAAKVIPCIERGRYIRFRRSDLEAFLTAHTVRPRKTPAYRPRRQKTQPPAK